MTARELQALLLYFHSFVWTVHAEQQTLKYAYRPVLLDGCVGPGSEVTPDGCEVLGVSEQLQIGGYGVELAIKNMEYSALDDSQVQLNCETNEYFLVVKWLARDLRLAILNCKIKCFQDNIRSSADCPSELVCYSCIDIALFPERSCHGSVASTFCVQGNLKMLTLRPPG